MYVITDKLTEYTIRIQRLYRKNKKEINDYNTIIKKLHLLFITIVKNVQHRYNIGFTQYDAYEIIMEISDEIFKELDKLPSHLSYNDSRTCLFSKTSSIKGKIINLISQSGGVNVSTLMMLVFGDTCYQNFNRNDVSIIEFLNKVFIPSGYNLYESKQYKNKVSILRSDSINKSLIELINGAVIDLNMGNRCMLIKGYFKNDSVKFHKENPFLTEKINGFKSRLEKEDSKDCYIEEYLNHSTLRDLLIMSVDEFVKDFRSGIELLRNVKTKLISSLVKEFLVSDKQKKRRMLVLYTIAEDNELKNLACLLYRLISKNSELSSIQDVGVEIYKTLQWSIQKSLINNEKKTLAKLEPNLEDDISYEDKIRYMNAPVYIKKKAWSKLKEINNGNESKARIYLDGLLNIPFGIYKEETILTFLKIFTNKLKKSITNLEDSVKHFEHDCDKLFEMNKEITVLCDVYNINEVKSDNQLNNFISKMKRVYSKLETKLSLFGTSENDEIIIYYKSKILLRDLIDEWENYKISRRSYISDAKKILDSCIHGQQDAKNHIEGILAQWINGKMKGNVFGLQGPPGVGKTTLCKNGISKCLLDSIGKPRPFAFIPLGGSTNGSILDGHSYTYTGSTWGKIVDILMETGCMNPIIYIDELDKVSKTERGQEIIGILTHLTDPSQNEQFTDKYFAGVKLDLSKCLIVFSYNDSSLIDKILRDRITEIKVKPITNNEKLYISKHYLIPDILDTLGYTISDIIIDDKNITHIIETYTYEAGVRKLQQLLFELVRQINLSRITCEKSICLPFNVTKDYIKHTFRNKPLNNYKKINKVPMVGLVNGLYATSAGVGGITVVEVMKTPSDQKLSLELTGQQGDVMKESMKCAKTVAWNVLPNIIKKRINREWNDIGKFGLHIHCPESSTPKDGPSAGLAITIAIISRLCNIPIKNTVSITGEIDLQGKSHKIGGLESKLTGARRAGVTRVLIPRDNQQDYNIILQSMDEKEKESYIKDLEVIFVDSIKGVIENSLTEHDIDFVF